MKLSRRKLTTSDKAEALTVLEGPLLTLASALGQIINKSPDLLTFENFSDKVKLFHSLALVESLATIMTSDEPLPPGGITEALILMSCQLLKVSNSELISLLSDLSAEDQKTVRMELAKKAPLPEDHTLIIVTLVDHLSFLYIRTYASVDELIADDSLPIQSTTFRLDVGIPGADMKERASDIIDVVYDELEKSENEITNMCVDTLH